MRMRTWLVGLALALSGQSAAIAKGPAKSSKASIAPLMKALESESVEDAAKAARKAERDAKKEAKADKP